MNPFLQKIIIILITLPSSLYSMQNLDSRTATLLQKCPLLEGYFQTSNINLQNTALMPNYKSFLRREGNNIFVKQINDILGEKKITSLQFPANRKFNFYPSPDCNWVIFDLDTKNPSSPFFWNLTTGNIWKIEERIEYSNIIMTNPTRAILAKKNDSGSVIYSINLITQKLEAPIAFSSHIKKFQSNFMGLLVAIFSDQIHIYNTNNDLKLLQTIPLLQGNEFFDFFSHGSLLTINNTAHKNLKIYDLNTNTYSTILYTSKYIKKVTFSRDNQHCALLEEDEHQKTLLRLFTKHSNLFEEVCPPINDLITSMDFAPYNKKIYAITKKGTTIILNSSNGLYEAIFLSQYGEKKEPIAFNAISFSLDGTTYICAQTEANQNECRAVIYQQYTTLPYTSLLTLETMYESAMNNKYSPQTTNAKKPLLGGIIPQKLLDHATATVPFTALASFLPILDNLCHSKATHEITEYINSIFHTFQPRNAK